MDQNAISGLAQLLCLLLSSLDAKTINLLRFYELQIDFLRRRLHGHLVPNEAERAAFAHLAARRLAARTWKPMFPSSTQKPSSGGTAP